MNILEKYIPFVKEQIDVQEKLAKKFEENQWRKELHMKSGETFKGLYQDIEATLNYIKDFKENRESTDTLPLKSTHNKNPLSVSYKEIEDLPAELVQELSLSDADKTEYVIEEVISECGGTASLDRLIVELYKSTGEIFKRNALTSRLYKMAQKNLIYSVPNRKGVYALMSVPKEAPMDELLNPGHTQDIG